MPDSLWMLAGFACAFLGMAWLALAIDVHWRDVHGPGVYDPHTPRSTDSPASTAAAASAAPITTLRILGIVALLTSLTLFLQADVATMACLVWMIALALAAMAVAFTLAWHGPALRWLWPVTHMPIR